MQVKANAVSAARVHVTRASAIRAHAHRLPLAVIVFLIALFFASVAYAADWYSVLYRSELDGSEQYIVSADDKWQAAAIICGKSKSFIDGLNDETRKKLATNGGSFQTLADGLTKVWPGWNEESLEDSLSEVFGGDTIGSLWFNMTSSFTVTNTYPFVGFNSSALSLFTVVDWQQECPTSIFAINVDPTLRAAAIEALNFIVGGGTIGGGSTAGADTMTFNLQNYVRTYEQVQVGNKLTLNSVDYTLYTNPNVVANFPTGNIVTFTGLVNKSVSSLRAFDFETYPNVLVFVYPRTTRLAYVVYALKDGYTCELVGNNFVITPASNDSCQYINVQNGPTISDLGISALPFDVTINVAGQSVTTSSGIQNLSLSSGGALYSDNLTGGGGGGGDEPNPWPEPEPPTDPPNVPEPPVVNPPPITGPDLPTDPPQDPTITPEPEPTGTDYTVYLLAIIRQLNQVMVQISNHCKHIRDQISTSANAIISNLHTFIGDLQESIDSNFVALNDYLEDLTIWYEDFTKEIMDDIQDEFSTVESILRQILRKIGVSRGTPKEIEKDVDDDFDFLEWLINFITSKLANVIDDFVGDVGGLIAGVKDKFPFSIPWDIAAILALLDGVPTTPVFTITIPAVNGWWQETRFVIDLHPFDSVAAAARIMINAWWVLVLAIKTNWLLMIMGDSTSIGERIANRMTGGE